jgi:hypothetical protein
LGLAEAVQTLWMLVLAAVERHSTSTSTGNATSTSSRTGDGSNIRIDHPAAWMASPLLRLAHQLLQVPPSPGRHRFTRPLMSNLLLTGTSMGTLSAHPVLQQAVTGRPGDVAIGAVAAEALRQVRVLTGSGCPPYLVTA